jgi:hypothetical protein
MRQNTLVQGLLGLLLAGLAAAAPASDLSPREEDLSPRAASSCHSPSNRACWTNGFDVSTDYEAKIPKTGVTKKV